MKSQNIKKATIVLNLQRSIIGVKFVDFQNEFDALKIPTPAKKGTLCYLLREAMEGNILKAVDSNVTCEYARYALGLSKPDITISEGRSYHYSGLYQSKGVAREIVSSMKYLSHEIYGIVVGPLELMEDADIVIMVDYAETIMRVMQGYAYKFGSPKNLNFFGNQAACGDLISKPYYNNDINVSLMCRGMRANGRFEKGELGVAIPIGIFDTLVDGVVATANPVSSHKEKKRILNALDNNDLGNKIDMHYNYGIGLKEYDERVKKIRNNSI
ncbi:DUF169 domain-containing protein [Alkaliphilus peptidifermentans]|uniref:Uncharacterized conserved protein, DUF169 family n=1 Tax=Alkaliphilus peptidifermentans DSM 18978 TaxID=1120976 RepID=A0A1G5E9S9_9FIRM|nr:DUF169 domain-containing protein [Alkaliphilus peptidifermentans]SCY23774.1 Uncharacterized conserved protein, DUF169 family [Alkaliphilus peptidifermentans DSM 18978]